jgi:hypothetical protein
MAARFAATKVLPLWKSGCQIGHPSGTLLNINSRLVSYDSQASAELVLLGFIISEGVSDVGKSQ